MFLRAISAVLIGFTGFHTFVGCFLSESRYVFIHHVPGGFELGMGDNSRPEHKKRLVMMIPDKLKRPLMNQVRCIIAFARAFITRQIHLLAILPEIVGIIIMTNALAIKSV